MGKDTWGRGHDAGRAKDTRRRMENGAKPHQGHENRSGRSPTKFTKASGGEAPSPKNSRRRMTDGRFEWPNRRWQLENEDGHWQVEEDRREMANARCQMPEGRGGMAEYDSRKTGSGRGRMTYDRWQMTGDGWRREDDRCKMTGGRGTRTDRWRMTDGK